MLPGAGGARRGVRHGRLRPEGWQARVREDQAAPQSGNRSGIARLFLWRRPRATGDGDGEAIHLSIRDRMAALPGYQPVGNINGE